MKCISFIAISTIFLCSCTTKHETSVPGNYSLTRDYSISEIYKFTDGYDFINGYNFTNHLIPTIEGLTFYDPNPPEVKVTFPFNIYYSRSEISRIVLNKVEVIEHILKNRDPYLDISIYKLNIDNSESNFQHINIPDTEQLVYYEGLKLGQIVIGRNTENYDQRIDLIVSKLIDEKNLITVRLSKETAKFKTLKEWENKHEFLISDYIKFGNKFYEQL